LRLSLRFGIIVRTAITHMMKFIRNSIEKSVFGVCSKAADSMGVRKTRVRLYFIYITFIAMGSPIILYVFLAFWMNVRKYIRRGRSWAFE